MTDHDRKAEKVRMARIREAAELIDVDPVYLARAIRRFDGQAASRTELRRTR